jgi:hypothetical protein
MTMLTLPELKVHGFVTDMWGHHMQGQHVNDSKLHGQHRTNELATT